MIALLLETMGLSFASTDQHFLDTGRLLSWKRHHQVQLVTSNGLFNMTRISDLMHHVETFFVTVVQEHDLWPGSSTHFAFNMSINGQ